VLSKSLLELKNHLKRNFSVIVSLAKKLDNYYKLLKYERISRRFKNKTGIELGGPSTVFMNHPEGIIPIYQSAKLIDGVNFRGNTI
jgi:hypothetical protein